jgi:hypothetical protein
MILIIKRGSLYRLLIKYRNSIYICLVDNMVEVEIKNTRYLNVALFIRDVQEGTCSTDHVSDDRTIQVEKRVGI